jgi:AcrR family transcriptional regulator
VVEARTHGERRKAKIIEAGLALWRDGKTVSARAIGREVGITHRTCLYHFGNAVALRDAVAVEAVRVGDAVIVPQLIVARHPAADALSASDRRRFLAGC